MKIHIYHHNDLDGIMAAVVLMQQNRKNQFIYENYLNITLTEKDIILNKIDYSDKLDFSSIEKDDVVYFLDYSFSNKDNLNELKKLTETTKYITWLDHHQSSKDIISDNKWILDNEAINVFIAENICGALLTYLFFNYTEELLSYNNYIIPESILDNPKIKIPTVLRYVDDYDCWKKLDEDSNYFMYGVTPYLDLSNKECLDKLINLISCSYEHISTRSVLDVSSSRSSFNSSIYINKIIKNGKIIREYVLADNKINHLEEYSFECEIKGHKCLAINKRTNSEVFGDKINDYNMVCVYYYTGKNWKYSLFTAKDNIDVSKVAASYGGGGHKKAAGFILNESLW